MKAQIKPGYDNNRQKLADIIPIPTPFTLFITPSQLCNFKCSYCTQSLGVDVKKKIGFKLQLLDDETFLKLADQATEFPGKFKRVLLTGLGEPLVNPNISDMVTKLVGLDVAEKYEIFTNASLLTHGMSDRLISSGLTYLRISIQGLSSQQYKSVTGTKINYDELLGNIKYFYEHRINCKVYIKIIDALLNDEADKKRFFDLFGNICDNIFIEHLLNAQPSMTDHYNDKVGNAATFYGEDSVDREVCPYIFYAIQTDADGNVFPCPPLGLPLSFSLGNINDISLIDIWNGGKLRSLRLLHLKGDRNNHPVCGKCNCYKAFTPESDNIDNSTDRLIKLIQGVT